MHYTEKDLERFINNIRIANGKEPKKIKDTKKPKKSKYRNKRIKYDGYIFDSIKEANFYKLLKTMKKQGKIKDFSLQPRFLLQEGFKKGDKKYQPIYYVADFKVLENDGSIKIIDVKSSKSNLTPVYKIKKKLFESRYKDLTITEIYDVNFY